MSRVSTGKPTRQTAVLGSPPMAYTSERALAAESSEGERVVNDGRKEIHRVHQRALIIQAQNAGILAAAETCKKLGEGALRKAAEGLVQDTGPEFCAASGKP